MSLESRLATGLALSLALVYWTTPVAVRVAGRLGFYDKPLGYKGHARPTPYLGGAAVMAGFVVAAAVFTHDWERTLPLVSGVLVLWIVGTVDDRRNVPWWLRVGVEVGLAAGLWALGHGWSIEQGPLVDLGLTIVWVVLVVNAFNLFDNMDGAASSMGLVIAGGLAVLGVVRGDTWLALTAITLSGACMGFLPHNLSSPARIFLGDGGSMPLGFAVAALTMIGVSDAVPEWQALAAGLLLVGVPLLDTSLVVVSRTARGISILTGGRDHLTHRSRRRLRTARAVALTLGAVQAVVSCLALLAVEGGSEALLIAVLLYLVGVGTAIGLLDRRAAELEAEADEPDPASLRDPVPPESWILLVLAVLLAVSPLFSGYYDSRIWAPGGLVLLFVAAAGAIARPLRPTGAALCALAGLAGLSVVALVSSQWGDSAEQAVVEGNRYAVYAALLLALLVLVRSQKGAAWLLSGLIAGTIAVAGVVIVRMLGTDPSDVFLGGRLDQPLGYINGEASFFLLGCWLCLGLAEHRRRPWLAGAGLGAATVMASLMLLTLSRGAALALAASLIVTFAIVPGRLARVAGVALAGLGVFLAGPALLDVFESGRGGVVLPDDVVRRAARAALVAGAGVAVAWTLLVALAQRLDARGTLVLRRAGAVAVSAAAIAIAGLAVASAERIENTARAQYDAFVHLGEVTGTGLSGQPAAARLVSGAGTRYDYWRIAWDAWQDEPVRGVGAGNFDGPYFRQRATVEDVRQPHSITMQALSETGVAGTLMLLLLMAGLAWGAWRSRALARAGDAGRMAAVAGVGCLAAWLAHTNVDWIHLLPGVTGVALAAGALLLRTPQPAPAEAPSPLRLPRPALAAGISVVAAIFAFAVLLLGRQALAEYFTDRAQAALKDDPAQTIVGADRALRLDADAIRPYYLKAAALARFNEADAAEATLREAARREPGDFVTWALLGDLAVRRGRIAEAREAYGRAARLNPRDEGLRALASDPRRANESS